jgi:4,5-dihydroxyphthalate decarboxylase
VAQPTLRLGFADHDLNTAIIDGMVHVEGFDLDITHSTNDGEIHSLLREGKLDACEYSFGGYVGDRSRGVPYIAIPAFPNRKFRLSYIFVNNAAAIGSAKDLEGRRVGILLWSNTAGIWARGALQHHYGVDLTRIKWLSRQTPPANLPAGITVEKLPDGSSMDEMLVAGQLDAVIQADVPASITRKDPRVRRLFPD